MAIDALQEYVVDDPCAAWPRREDGILTTAWHAAAENSLRVLRALAGWPEVFIAPEIFMELAGDGDDFPEFTNAPKVEIAVLKLRDGKGRTPLHAAAEGPNSEESFNVLLAKRFDGVWCAARRLASHQHSRNRTLPAPASPAHT